MNFSEFQQQDRYCRENNTPEGVGCSKCPANGNPHCADALRNLAGKFLDTLHRKGDTTEIVKQLKGEFGLTAWNILALAKGELEFPE